MSDIEIKVVTLSKPVKTLKVEAGTTVEELIEEELNMDSDGKTVTINAAVAQMTDTLRAGDFVEVKANSEGA